MSTAPDLLALDRVVEELSRVVEAAFADLDLAHERVDPRRARLDLALQRVRGREERLGGLERPPHRVGLLGVERARHRLHRDGETEADDARVLLRLDRIGEDRGRGLAHAELDEHRRDEGRGLGRRRVEAIRFARGGERRDAQELGVAAEVLFVGARPLRRRDGACARDRASCPTRAARRPPRARRMSSGRVICGSATFAFSMRGERALGIGVAKVDRDEHRRARLERAHRLEAFFARDLRAARAARRA